MHEWRSFLFIPHSTGVNDCVWVVDCEESQQQDIIIISPVLDLAANLTTHHTPTKWKSVLLKNKELKKTPQKTPTGYSFWSSFKGRIWMVK